MIRLEGFFIKHTMVLYSHTEWFSSRNLRLQYTSVQSFSLIVLYKEITVYISCYFLHLLAVGLL